MTAEPKLDEISDVVRELVKERMDRFGFDRAEVHTGNDHSGAPALFIDVFYHLSQEPVDTYQVFRLQTDLRDKLMHEGEKRFPYVRHHFDEKQQVAKRKCVKRR
jgi:hypothetical protein